ncbi:Spy/CpxP family protein refolding chaperone [Calothrix sp. 336/3]|uniref:Spy/CpxP family protein refolding chaperone n=1 Tax=Calothrix sp. 336/3 TaxID=1337936 RepID=UPI0004E2A063|nr:Spy/CpxP family protein refolding chaperone [Calothrix sp. 336/3]AKG22933.1 hypothetical protein IJ00_18100 [Calothrix sp. 336/3]
MSKQNRIDSLTFASLLIVFGTLFTLSSCTTTDTKTSPTTTAEPTATQTKSETQSETGNNPINAFLGNSDRQGTDPLELMQNSQVKSELKLTDDQIAKLKQIDTNFRQKVKEKASGIKPESATEEQIKSVRSDIEKLNQETRVEVGKTLNADQVKRARQIFLQLYGWGILTKDDFSQDLKLTADQTAKLNKLSDDTVQKMKDNWVAPKSDASPTEKNQTLANNTKKMEQILKDSNQEAESYLTDEQKKTLESLKGAKFQLDPKSLPSPASQ